jgi:hypothetical protein
MSGDVIKTRTVSIEQFSTLRRDHALSGRWIFRGQSDSRWSLRSRLERHLKTFRLNGDAFSMRATERWMLREFRRSCHHHLNDLPGENSNLEWLSLMQHHGAPTRLVDWTFSEWVALFFALRDAARRGKPTCAVWAIDQRPLWTELKKSLTPDLRRLIERNDKDPDVLNWLLFECNREGVATLNPLRLTPRLSVQQGTFLLPLKAEASFEANLMASIRGRAGSLRKFVIKCTPSEVLKGLKLLHRANISYLSLFPGLDGFAQSIQYRALFADLRVPK